jgi:phage repressor protein C with HTH and peptisase S24 domain
METNEGLQLRKYLRDANISQESFAETLGMTRQGLGVHLRKTELSLDFKAKLLSNGVDIFANVNADNTKLSSSISNARAVDMTKMTVMYVPLVTKHAYAGYLSGFGDDEYISSLTTIPMIDDKEYKGNYLAFEVKGDSMDNDTKDSYEQGDIVICRELAQTHWHSKLHIFKYDFVIVTRTEGILIKRIVDHDTTAGILTLHSLNSMYDDQRVSLNDVAQIFNVVKVIREK